MNKNILLQLANTNEKKILLTYIGGLKDETMISMKLL